MQVKHLSFSYGKHTVLKDVSFEVKQGKITTVLGSNGSGKSTLFYLMTKNLQIQKGEIFLGEKNIRAIQLKEFAQKVSIVNQTNTISGDITVEKLVGYGRTPFLSLMKRMSKEDEELVDWAMEITDVQKYRDREVTRLSGGQRQRVWIAMALAQNTKILFLDEPTTYLDIRYQIQILSLIKRLNQEFGMTIVMVLHDINQTIYYSDEVIGLRDGRVMTHGNPIEIITPEMIETIYGIRLRVMQDSGKRFVLQV